jgi:hypothetical protein
MVAEKSREERLFFLLASSQAAGDTGGVCVRPQRGVLEGAIVVEGHQEQQ